MGLDHYRKKRDFSVTPEPSATAKGPARHARTRRNATFVVQKHDASHLHYDFRLEIDGELKSWAVPKGPSLDPRERALAVEVEDHPLSYGGFEGTIPKGQYGGGTVMLWDRGKWTLREGNSPAAAWRAGKIKFTLDGEKLRGDWMLVRMRETSSDTKHNWLLIKEKDDFARPAKVYDVRIAETLSVLSGRDLEAIALHEQAKPAPTANRAQSPKRTPEVPAKRQRANISAAVAKKASRIDPSRIGGAVPAVQPKFVPPQLAMLVDAVPEGDDWLYEIKFDGYRLVAICERGDVRLLTRNNKDWTHKFPELAADLRSAGVPDGILDGEAVILDERGVSHFQRLQNAISEGLSAQITYFAFDVPYWGGYDLTGCPLRERQALLARLVESDFSPKRTKAAQDRRSSAAQRRVQVSGHIANGDASVMRTACRLGLEGLICKRANSLYRAGERTRDWVKVKCAHEQEFVIGGYTDARGARVGFGALLLGYHDANGGLVYAGNVGTGFNTSMLRALGKKLKAQEKVKPSFVDPAGVGALGKVHWVAPRLVAEVAFTEWTEDGRLRHPVFRGLREDKDPRTIVRERPRSSSGRRARTTEPAAAKSERPPRRVPRNGKAGETADFDSTVLGVSISHPEREVYPDTAITKLDVANYYASIAAWIMPHVARRPLSVMRCAKGIGGECFFQKHMEAHELPGVGSVSITESKGPRQYVVVMRPSGLVALVQMNALEFHGWGARSDDIERPDRLVFDLDPGEGVKWAQVAEGAQRVREVLENLNLQCFVKTTGGKGLHVVAPIRRSMTWDVVKPFCRAVASLLAKAEPQRYVDTMAKDKRQGKVFIDYLRNGRGATSIVPYSTRARAGATVSMPVGWKNLKSISPDAFTVRTVPTLLSRRTKDPWEGFESVKQSVTQAAIASLLKACQC